MGTGFLPLLLITVYASIDSKVFEYNCGDGYDCKGKDSLSYLMYVIYYDNYGYDVLEGRARISFTVDENDYDFKAVDIYTTYQDLEDPHSYSPTEDHGKSVDFKITTNIFNDNTRLDITALSLPREKTMKFSVLVEVLPDWNDFIEEISAIITFKTEMYIKGHSVAKTSDWKKIGEIDAHLISNLRSSVYEDRSNDTAHQNTIEPKLPDFRLFTIAVVTGIAMSMALVSYAVFYIKKHQDGYILMKETSHFG